MGIGIFDWIKAIFSKIWNFIMDHIKEILIAVLIICVIVFAFPYIAGLLPKGSILGKLLLGAASATTTAITTAWGWITATAGSAWTSFKALKFYQQAIAVGTVGLLIAPEETSELITEIIEVGTNALGSVVSGGISAVGPLLLIGAAFFILPSLIKSRSESVTPVAAEEDERVNEEDALIAQANEETFNPSYEKREVLQ